MGPDLEAGNCFYKSVPLNLNFHAQIPQSQSCRTDETVQTRDQMRRTQNFSKTDLLVTCHFPPKK